MKVIIFKNNNNILLSLYFDLQVFKLQTSNATMAGNNNIEDIHNNLYLFQKQYNFDKFDCASMVPERYTWSHKG